MPNYFIHIPRTGGTSVASSLPYGCAIYLGHDIRSPGYRHPGQVCTAEDYAFAFLRDPYDRLVSAFSFLRKGGSSDDDRADAEMLGITHRDFGDFVTGSLAAAATWQVHLLPQKFFLDGVPRVQVFDFGRQQEAFPAICRALGVDPGRPLENLNSSERHGVVGDYYDDETAAIVREVYRDDFDLLDRIRAGAPA